jgi:hypothetical protein
MKKALSYMLLLLLIIVFLSSPLAYAQASETGLAIERIDVPTISRSWTDIELLYQNQFHDPEEVEEEIQRIHDHAPDIVDLTVIGQSYEGRNISCLRITNELNTEQKAKTLVVAHHHGREQVTVDMALYFIIHLLNGYGDDEILTHYVDTEEIYVIPTLNPDALELVVNEGAHFLRKNLRPYDNDGDGLFDEDPVEDTNGDGIISEYPVYEKDGDDLVWLYSTYEGIDNDEDGLVNEDEVGLTDLNRNYDAGWGNEPGSSSDPTSQVYHGSEPFSEPETQAFRDFTLNHRFSMAYSLHTGINCTFFVADQYGHWEELLLSSNVLNDLYDILPSSYNQIYGYSPAISRRFQSGYYGLWEDWLYHERNTVLPITFEMYHNASSDAPGSEVIIFENSTHVITQWDRIYGYFNPVESHIEKLWMETQEAFDYLLEMTPRLDVTSTAISGDTAAGSSISITFSSKCLSRRLDTTGTIHLLDLEGVILDSLSIIEAQETRIDTAQFDLSTNVNQSGLILRVGNEYTGYTQFNVTLRIAVPDYTFWLIITGAGTSIFIIIVVAVLYIRKNRGTP